MIDRRSFALAAAIGFAGSLPALADDAADRATLRDSLMKREAASWQFVKTGDLVAMRDHLADDALLIFGNGSRFTKAEYLKVMPALKLDSFAIGRNTELILIAPNVATLLYRATYTSAMGNENATTIKVLSSSTYVRRNGKWLSVLYQETPTT